MKKLLLVLGLIIALVPVNSFAGKLNDFESSVTNKKHEKKKKEKKDNGNRDSHGHHRPREDRDEHHHHDSDDGCHGFFSCLFGVFVEVYASSSSSGSETRKPDNPRDSLIIFDVAYQNLEPGIFGLDASFQVRLKRVNIDGRLTRYVETSPSDTLDVIQFKVVYPIRLGRSLTVGGALGTYTLAGNSTSTGGLFGFPITYQVPGSYWEFGMTPLWGNISDNNISDLDFRVSYRTSRANFFAGHRAINAGSQSLSGPYFGLGLNI